MDKWIKQLERKTIDNHGTSELSQTHKQYIYYSSMRPDKIQLNGEFTIEQLESLVTHMKKYNK